PPAPAHAVHTYLSRLRSALQPAGPGRANIVGRTPGGYQLNLTDDQLDLADFRRHVRQARTADPPQALDMLETALALRRGPPPPHRPAPTSRTRRRSSPPTSTTSPDASPHSHTSTASSTPATTHQPSSSPRCPAPPASARPPSPCTGHTRSDTGSPTGSYTST